MVKRLFHSWVSVQEPRSAGGAKDDAINPRLGNRYSLFPLSHRRDDCSFFLLKEEQRLERSQVAQPNTF